MGVYTEATCYEFHQLLVALLIAYANVLGALCKAEWDLEEHRDMETMKMRKDCTEKVWQCTYLWWIACLHIFWQHLVLLCRGLWLHQPIDSQRELSVAELGLFTGCCKYTDILPFLFIIYSLYYFSDIFLTLII